MKDFGWGKYKPISSKKFRFWREAFTFFAFRFFFALALALTKPELNRYRSIEAYDWSIRCHGIDKKLPLLFTIHQNIFMNIFPFYFYYILWRNQPWSFYAYWKVIGFAILSTIAALLFFLQFPWAITDNFILTNLEIE